MSSASNRAEDLEESTDERTISQSQITHRHRRRRPRKGVVWYDTVTGKLKAQRVASRSYTSRWRHFNVTAGHSKKSVNTQIVHENDDPWVDEVLMSGDPILPESELLEAILVYSGHYYANAVDSKASRDFSSMSGSALLTMGILLEELGNISLGKTGYKALLEHEDVSDSALTLDSHDASSEYSAGIIRKRSKSVMSNGTSILSETDKESTTSRRRNRTNKKPRFESSAALTHT